LTHRRVGGENVTCKWRAASDAVYRLSGAGIEDLTLDDLCASARIDDWIAAGIGESRPEILAKITSGRSRSPPQNCLTGKALTSIPTTAPVIKKPTLARFTAWSRRARRAVLNHPRARDGRSDSIPVGAFVGPRLILGLGAPIP